MSCDSARSRRYGNDDRCGPDAEYFVPRRVPHLLTAFMIVTGLTLGLAYLAFLRWVTRY